MASTYKTLDMQKLDRTLIGASVHSSSETGQVTSRKVSLNKVIYIIKSSKTERENGSKCYKCSACDYSNDSTTNIYKHMRSKHKQSVFKRLDGTICKPETVKYSVDVEDTHSHVGDAQAVRVAKVSKEERNLGEKMYRCSVCGKSSNSTGNLYRHMENNHKGYRIDRIYQLDPTIQRDQTFEANDIPNTSSSKIVRIVKSSAEEVARGEKHYKCSECGKGSNSTGNLYNHMDVSHPEYVVQLVRPNTHSTVPLNASTSSGTSEERVCKITYVTKGGKTLYKCSLCCLVSTGTGNIYKHMRRQHKGFRIIKNLRKKRNFVKSGCYSMNGRRNRHSTPVETDNIVDNDMNVVSNVVHGSRNVDDESSNANIQAYECSVCMDTFTSCSELDSHVKQFHADRNSNGICSASNDNSEDDVEEDDDGGEFDEGKQLNNSRITGIANNDKQKNDETRSETLDHFQHASPTNDSILLTDENKGRDTSGSHSTLDASYSLTRTFEDPESYGKKKSRLFSVSASVPDDSRKIVTIIKNSSGQDWGMYRCSECNKTDNSTSNLYRHMATHHEPYGFRIVKILSKPEKRLKMSTTVAMMGEERIVKVIINSKSERANGSKKYSCSECGHENDSTSNLYKHMRNTHPGLIVHKIKEGEAKTQKNQNEPNPKHQSQSSDDIVRIIKIPQSGESDTKFQCSRCGFENSLMKSVYSHIRNDHKGCVIERVRSRAQMSPSPSRNPGDYSKTIRVLRTSPLERSRGGKMYQCSECSYQNNSTGNVYKHMKRCHEDCFIEKLMEVNRYYDICNTNAEFDSSVVRAISIPSRQGANYKCSKCYKTGTSTSNLYRHMERCHPEFNILKKVRTSGTGLDDLRREQMSRSWSDSDSDDNDDGDYNDQDNITAVSTLAFDSYECCVCMELFSSCETLDAHINAKHP